jgi:hypothetical protein
MDTCPAYKLIGKTIMNKIAYILTLTAGTAFAVAASSEEASENASVWSTFKSNTKENAGNLWEATKERSGTVWEATKAGTVTAFDATKEGAAAAASYVGDRFIIGTDVAANWTDEQFKEFSSNHPEIAANIDGFGAYVAGNREVLFKKAKDGTLVAYDVASDGTKTAIDWTSDRVDQIQQITACDIADYDMLGGVALGTLGTSMIAGASTAAATTVYVTTIAVPTSSGLLVLGSGVTGAVSAVVSAPAVAIGVTVAAAAGATVYATAKGLCYFKDEEIPTE